MSARPATTCRFGPWTAAAAVIVAMLAGSAAAQVGDSASGALADYLAKPDSSSDWSVRARYRRHGTEILELRLRSQTWRGVPWLHLLYVIKPPKLESVDRGVMVVAGGQWQEAYDSEPVGEPPRRDLALFTRMAKRLNSVVAVIAQVPYQPLFELDEDQLIAYTFDQYRQSGDAEWPLLLPMVKSVVRAMDSVQTAASSEWQIDLQEFTLVGGSKRGWTTWLTAAMDRRVTALAPIVFDALNMSSHFPYQTAAWGAPSEAIRPYTDLKLDEYLSSDAGRPLREIVDPFSYRTQLLQPKLIIVATNDEFFPVDSLNLYWPELAGPKYILYLPNNGHGVRDFGRIFPGLRALNRRTTPGAELPELVWRYQQDSSGMMLDIRSNEAPRKVRLWTAESADRDFRDALWDSRPLRRHGGRYAVELARPGNGYLAVFAEAVFGRGRRAYALSTNLCVLGAEPAEAAYLGFDGQQRVCGSADD